MPQRSSCRPFQSYVPTPYVSCLQLASLGLIIIPASGGATSRVIALLAKKEIPWVSRGTAQSHSKQLIRLCLISQPNHSAC